MTLTLVTGGTRGIGAAIARRLAAAGHDLVLGYHADEAAAAKTVTEIRALGVRCEAVSADLGEEHGASTLLDAVADRLPGVPLTGVVNNAGATYRYAPLADTPPAEIRRIVEVNLTAPLLIAQAAVRAMSTAHGGSGGVLVNISSGAATLGSPGEYVHYAAAKAGVDAFTKGLGLEVAAQGIRVVGVAPGLVATGLHEATGDPGRVKRMAAGIPLGRAAESDEIAAAVAWLMSAEASYVTATTLRVAGGR